MEKTVYAKLTEKERAVMARIADGEDFKTIIKVLDLYQKIKAVNTIASSPDHETTVLNRGMIQGATFFPGFSGYCKKKLKERKSD
jgi:FixJ family two-component response regulator